MSRRFKTKQEAEEYKATYNYMSGYNIKNCELCSGYIVVGSNGKYCVHCSSDLSKERSKGGYTNRSVKRVDKSECYFCGNRQTILLEIHHIDTDTRNNNYNNLVCLCKKCHRRLHSKIYSRLVKSKAYMTVKREMINTRCKVKLDIA